MVVPVEQALVLLPKKLVFLIHWGIAFLQVSVILLGLEEIINLPQPARCTVQTSTCFSQAHVQLTIATFKITAAIYELLHTICDVRQLMYFPLTDFPTNLLRV